MPNVFELGFGASDHEIALDSIPVTGRIPEWLNGTLLRNGPGSFTVGQQRYRHWFDGLAMLHKFSFQGGRVSYANKFLETQVYKAARETGQISYSEFATDPCRSLFGRAMAVFSPKISDNAKVSLAKIADQFVALAETPIQVHFDPHTLRSVGVSQYEPNPVGQMTTVHPQFDFTEDSVYNLVTRYHRVSHYRIYRMRGAGGPQLAASMPVSQPAYMHSFGMSRNYVILSEFPLVVNPLHLLLWLRPFIENFRWKPWHGTPFYVLNRHTGELVARFESEPFFAFHHVNAFEQGDDLVVDIDAYDDNSILQAYYLQRLQDADAELPFGQLRRYRLPLKAKKGTRVTHELISDECLELPRFDYERLNMNGSYRYVYGVSLNKAQRQGFYNQIVKIDIEGRAAQRWHSAGCYPGEPVFVGAPGRTVEDEGVALSVVLDAANGRSFLLVLDAQSFEEIGRAELPHAVLFGYHGDFFGGV
jgi:carotenoid cleavage dioxygenase-like enzyme